MSGWDSDAHAGPKLGRTLELARKERGLSLKQVEEATKIRAGYLAELERENFGVLPAVYAQGSLKTYANFLGLDGGGMVRELKRRQAPREEYPLYVGPREDEPDDLPTVPGGATGEEGDNPQALLSAGITGYLYLGSALVLVLAVAALAITAAGDGGPAVSQVREPLVSEAPRPSPPDAGENDRPQQPSQNDEQRSEGEHNTDESADPTSQAGQDREDPPPTPSSASATATASAAGTASATAPATAGREVEEPPAPTQPRPAPPPATAAPVRSSPASAQPTDPASQDSAAAPLSSPAAGRSAEASSEGPWNPSARNDGGSKLRVKIGNEDEVRRTDGQFAD